MNINEAGRKKRTVAKVFAAREAKGQNGNFEVMDFTAALQGEAEAVKYFVTFKALQEYIKDGAIIDCDVDVKPSGKTDPDGQPYHNRKVTQIYVNGQPVSGAKKFGGFQKDSPEQRASIEAQTAIKEIGECWRSGKFQDTDPEVATYRGWLHAKLGVVLPKPQAKSNSEQDWEKMGRKAPVNPPAPAQAVQAPSDQGGTKERERENGKCPIDEAWLAETMKIVRWSDITLKTWLFQQKWGLITKDMPLVNVLKSLNAEQVKQVCDKLTELRQAAGK